jgi:hypothetical protein
MNQFRYNPAPSDGTRRLHSNRNGSLQKQKGCSLAPLLQDLPGLPPGMPVPPSGARVLLAELVNAAAGIHDLLLARIERVAVRADFNLQVLREGRPRLEGVPAAAQHGDLFVLGMYAGLHGFYWAPLMGAPL